MSDLHPRNVLLVEDSPSDARLIREYLKEQAWSEARPEPAVRHVDRLADAVAASDEDTDIVLLDLGLPDSTGFETLETMLDAVGDEPVVVLTGLDDDRVGVEAVERGAQDFLVKDDVDPKLLQRTVRYAIERERQQRELQRRNEELALLNRIVRHDIKNDLTIILGWGDALAEHVDPAGRAHLDRIMTASEHIAAIAETTGDFLQILDDDSEAELHPVRLDDVLQTEIDKARSAHDRATIALTDPIPGGVAVEATELLSSVFRNLLNNAVTHNDKDNPEITVRVAVDDTDVTVSVADNGPGIPDSQRSEIFRRGEMGVHSGGTGVGLYLVETLVLMYDGTVEIEDRADWADDPELDGSVFTVRLPRV